MPRQIVSRLESNFRIPGLGNVTFTSRGLIRLKITTHVSWKPLKAHVMPILTARAQIYEHLLDQLGMQCMGCDRTFDDPRYLELDHNTPRSDGGLNHISHRILLCGPCNRLKNNTDTLSGLWRENKKRGYMTSQGKLL